MPKKKLMSWHLDQNGAKNGPKRAKMTKKGSKMGEKWKNDPKFRFPTLKLVYVEIFRSNRPF